ncbi:MAG: N-acetylmuramoyl-L-alanine amidase [Clostridia bacterium]|nr:N-acetylmuramoyl-L-alanine amidase [Clostridia bacterium]
MKIYIDQGHNPVNPNAGAEGNGLREQDINFDVGIRLAELLEQDPFFEVRLSRPTPETQLGTSTATSLAARVDDANNWGADYFISLHCNSNPNPNVSGSEAYVYSASSPAYELAEDLLDGLENTTGLTDRGVFINRGLYVLRRTRMPAVLVELGYLSNAGDAAKLRDDPQSFANGLYNGLREYFDLD